MPEPNRDDDATDIRYDNWPVGGRERYADWDVQRATPRERDGTVEELAEEYEAEGADDVVWIGLAGGGEWGTPYFYSPPEAAVYRGEIDEADQRVILREASHQDVEEESLGERIEEIGDDHDWEWVSSFAREYLEDDEADDEADDADRETTFARRATEFQQRNVAETDPYDLAFFGSHVFEDESGRIHTIERFFDVFTDDSSTVSRIAVEEEYLIADEPEAERRAGDATPVEENRRELDPSFDAESPGDEGAIETRLEEWHRARVGWPRETRRGT